MANDGSASTRWNSANGTSSGEWLQLDFGGPRTFDRTTLRERFGRIARYKVTHALLVPTMFVRLLRLPQALRHKYDLSSLQFIMHGGAPCSPHVKQAMIDWLGPIVTEHYGSTEVGVITFCDSAQWLAHPGTVGRPLSHVRVEVVDKDNTIVSGISRVTLRAEWSRNGTKQNKQLVFYVYRAG